MDEYRRLEEIKRKMDEDISYANYISGAGVIVIKVKYKKWSTLARHRGKRAGARR